MVHRCSHASRQARAKSLWEESHARLSAPVGLLAEALDSSTGMSTTCHVPSSHLNDYCDEPVASHCNRDGLVEDIDAPSSQHCGCRVAECKQGGFVADAMAEA